MTIPVTDPYYRVEVDAGPYAWATEKGDPADYGLADPLRVSWSLPSNNPMLSAPPDPLAASFSVVAASLSELSGLVRGAAVSIRVYGWPPGTPNPHAQADDLDPIDYPPIVIFRGRVANVDADTHKLGMVVTYSCVDYTVDLAEAPAIGAGDWPEEGNDERLGRMFDEADVPRPVPWFIGGDGSPHWFLSSFNVNARPGSPADARSMIQQLIAWVASDPDWPFPSYNYLTTSYTAGFLDGDAPDPAAPFAIPFTNGLRLRSGGTGEPPRLPGVFVETQPGLWGVDIVEDTDRRAAVINADHVDFSARWSQTKATDPDTVTVTGRFIETTLEDPIIHSSVTVAAPDPIPIGISLPCDATPLDVAQEYGAANLRSGDSDQWSADTFTWYADQDPWPMIADGLWFIEGPHVLAATFPVVVEGIDPARTPNGLDWYAGRLRSATFTLAGGRYSVAFQLKRSLPRPQVWDAPTPDEGVATLSWDDLQVAPTNVLPWDDLDPAFTWFDARLLRSP